MRYRLEVQICGGFSLISLPCHLGLWNKLLPVSNSVWVPIVGIIDLMSLYFQRFQSSSRGGILYHEITHDIVWVIWL